MPKTIKIGDGLQYRRIPRPAVLNHLTQSFVSQPVRSLKDLRIRMGPFRAASDGFAFANKFQMTVENARQLRNRLMGNWPSVFNLFITSFRNVLDALKVDINPTGIGPSVIVT